MATVTFNLPSKQALEIITENSSGGPITIAALGTHSVAPASSGSTDNTLALVVAAATAAPTDNYVITLLVEQKSSLTSGEAALVASLIQDRFPVSNIFVRIAAV
mgnify:CR=1 FL=1